MSESDEDSFWREFPLFAPAGTTVPHYRSDENPTTVPDALGALSHVLYDDETPEEISEDLRDEGNVLFKQNTKESFKRAIAKYTAAIDTKCNIPHVNCAAYTNRAAAQFKLKNYGKALSDAEKAIEYDSKNLKARFRAVQSAVALKKFDKAISHCEAATRAESGCKPEDLRWFRGQRRTAEKQLETDIMVEQNRALSSKKLKEDGMNLIAALAARNVTMGYPLFAQQRRYSRVDPTFDRDSDVMFWPVLLVYPDLTLSDAREQSDYVEEVCEDARICDVLDVVFPEDGTAPRWDVTGIYSSNRSCLRAFYRVQWTKPLNDATVANDCAFVGSSLGPEDMGGWKRLDSNMTIAQVTSSSDYIVPLFPVLYIVPALSTDGDSSCLRALPR